MELRYTVMIYNEFSIEEVLRYKKISRSRHVGEIQWNNESGRKTE